MLTFLKSWTRPDTFHAVLSERSGRWYNACLRITRDADLAADAVQKALLKAWDRRDEFRDESDLDTLAIHRGDVARDALAGTARNDARDETRKPAVFWLAQLRGNEGADITASVMFNDKSAGVREHAAFALGQSKAPRVAADLIRLGNTDPSGEVRAQAWFWLAQTGAPEAEDAIVAALRKDRDDDVRERALFSLSQLPDERATRALIAAAEDQSLSRELRKRAVFWLAQSESASAQTYLERVLTANH